LVYCKHITLFIGLCFTLLLTYGQDSNTPEELILFEGSEELSASHTWQLEKWDWLRQHPVNLNNATEDELKQLPYLNDFQIQSIIQHRKRYGSFVTLYELPYVFGFDEQLTQQLAPYVTLTETVRYEEVARIRSYGTEIITRVKSQTETPNGYFYANDTARNTFYTGSKPKLLFRAISEPNKHIQLGMRAEKDAGEPFFKGINQYGFDHYSGFMEIKSLGNFTKICLGDYAINTSFGLQFNTGGFIGSGYAEQILTAKPTLRGIASADENIFLRGTAITYSLNNWTFTPFISHKKLDANLKDSLVNGVTTFTSLGLSGIHNTPALEADKHVLNETVYGIQTQVNFSRLRLGLTAVNITRQGNYMPSNPVPPYTLHKDFTSVGTDYLWMTGKVFWFGEIAASKNGISWLSGFQIKPQSNFYFTFLLRDYNESEKHPYRNPFTHGSNIYFQHGAYAGLTFYPIRQIKLRAYHDRYISKHPEYLLNRRQQRHYSLAEMQFANDGPWRWIFRINHGQKFIADSPENETVKLSIEENKNSGQYRLYYQTEKWRYYVQMAYTWVAANNREYGQLVGNHFQYQMTRLPMQWKTGHFLFDTQGYSSRIYAYEPDVLYAFSIPAFYGKGNAWYAMIKYEINNRMQAWIKISQTYKPYESSLGSGLSETPGNKRTYVSMQIRLKM